MKITITSEDIAVLLNALGARFTAPSRPDTGPGPSGPLEERELNDYNSAISAANEVSDDDAAGGVADRVAPFGLAQWIRERGKRYQEDAQDSRELRGKLKEWERKASHLRICHLPLYPCIATAPAATAKHSAWEHSEAVSVDTFRKWTGQRCGACVEILESKPQ